MKQENALNLLFHKKNRLIHNAVDKSEDKLIITWIKKDILK